MQRGRSSERSLECTEAGGGGPWGQPGPVTGMGEFQQSEVNIAEDTPGRPGHYAPFLSARRSFHGGDQGVTVTRQSRGRQGPWPLPSPAVVLSHAPIP